MKKQSFSLNVSFFFLSALLLASPLLAQNPQTSSPGVVQVTVTATTKKSGEVPPVLQKQDISVHEGGKRTPVVDCVPANTPDAKLQLVILIDQDANTRLSAHFDEIAQFVRALPTNSSVAVAYAQNGSAQVRSAFTADRETAINALRMTFGAAAGMTSVYEALTDLIKRWPAGVPRREVLLLSDGIDPTYGFHDTAPGENPALQQATEAAQHANITVFSIFVGTSGREARSGMLNLNGQGSLNELTSDTGGFSFFQGNGTAISFQPFLRDLGAMLGQQYLLTFSAAPLKKAAYRELKVSTEVSHVKLLAPAQVYLPATQ